MRSYPNTFIKLLLIVLFIGPNLSIISAQNLASRSTRVVSNDLNKGDGLKAEYFNLIKPSSFAANTHESNRLKVLTRTDRKIDFNWGEGSPDPRVKTDDFVVRWSGYLYTPEDAEYTFLASVDDGIKIWIDDKLIMNEWVRQNVNSFIAKVNLKGNTYHSFKAEYYEDWIHAVVKLEWQYNETEPRVIGSNYFYTKNPNVEIAKATTSVKNTSPVTAGKKTAPSVTTGTTPSKKPVEKKELAESKASGFGNLKANKTVVLSNIYFERSKYLLLAKSFKELDKLADALTYQKSVKIEIAGHTDNVGDPKLNVELSENRAMSVANYLISRGISEDRIVYKGYGGSKPISPNDTEENKARNRRVEFTVLEE